MQKKSNHRLGIDFSCSCSSSRASLERSTMFSSLPSTLLLVLLFEGTYGDALDKDLVVDFSVVGGGVGSCAVAKTESNPPVFFSLIVGGESCVLTMAESNPPDFVSVDLLLTVTLAVLGFAERIAILRIQCDFCCSLRLSVSCS